jgi:hypothetical protein
VGILLVKNFNNFAPTIINYHIKMKKLLLSAIAVMAFGFANAQDPVSTGFKQGDVFISGSVGYSSTKTGDNKNDQFTVIPRAAYFVTNNIALGAQIGYTTATQTVDTPLGSIDNDVDTFQAGVFGRYYFTPARNFSFFGQLGVGFSSTKNKPDGGDDTKDSGVNVGLAPGISYFVSDHIALEATWGLLGYSSYNPDGDGDNTNTFDIGVDLENINFGIVYKF